MIGLLFFHRSLSSSLSKWLHHAGLNMGHYLMPPAVSNPEGHFEDMPLFDLHDQLLALNEVDRRFDSEPALSPELALILSSVAGSAAGPSTTCHWAGDDPRAPPFFPILASSVVRASPAECSARPTR